MKRIQRQRTKGWMMPEGAVYVGRPSRWGNPFRLGETYMWLGATDLPYPIATWRESGLFDHGIRVERLVEPRIAVDWYRAWFATVADRPYWGLAALRSATALVCWCPLDQPCHADVLLELANR